MGGRGGSSHRSGAGGALAQARSFLARAYGTTHANAIMAFLSNAPSAIRELWSEFAGSFRASSADPDTDRAFYSPALGNVTLGIEHVAIGDRAHAPYTTVFHEYGHMTDNLIARKMGYGKYDDYSETYKGGLLGKTAKDEVSGHISRIMQIYPAFSKSDAVDHLISEAKGKYTLRDRSDLSDMFEGAGIGKAFPLGVGHGLEYWQRVNNGAEIFAEITSAEASNPGSLKAIKEYFPKTYEVYHQMLKERKNR